MRVDEFEQYLFNLPGNFDNFCYFLEELKKGNCVALVGAGLSKQVGLPTWEELIFELCGECNINYSKEDVLSDHNILYDLAQDIKDSLSENDYLEILNRKLMPPNIEWGETHRYLLEANFNSFLTTNYDDTLEQAAIALPDSKSGMNIQFYPVLDQTLLKERTIFYLHGKIKEKAIVFTRNDYEQAYKQHSDIEDVLWDAYSKMSIAIICCSFEDNYMIELFEKFKRKLDDRVMVQKIIRFDKSDSKTYKHFFLKGLEEESNLAEIMGNYWTRFETIDACPIFYKLPRKDAHINLKILLRKLPKYEFKKERIEVRVTYEAQLL